MNSEQIILQKIIQAGLLNDGDQICYQSQQGVITKAGTVYQDDKYFHSVSDWFFDVNRRLSLPDEQYPWTKVFARGESLENLRTKLAESDGVVPDLKQNNQTDFETATAWSTNEKKRKNDSGDSASYDEDSESRKQRKTNGGDVAQHRYASDAGSYQAASSSSSCKYPNCMVCNKGLPSHFNTQSPTWADILQVVLYALGISHPQKEFFSLGKEIYDYIDVHWDKLSAKPRSSTWKQTAKMTLAHSRYANLFENGYDIFMKTGFWRLKKQSNPYELSGASGTSRPSHDTSDRAEELPSEESDHELRADRSWESNGNKLNSPPAYKINYLLAENNGPQPSIPNLTGYNPAVQMPPPPMAPQFYNAYNSFQKPQMSSPPSQFNAIKPNDFISQAPNPNFYPSMTLNNAAPGQNIPPLPHAFFSRRFSVDEGAKTLEDLRNASNFGVAEPESGFYPQQHRLPDVNSHIENGAMHSSSELILNTSQIKEEQQQQLEPIVMKQQSTSATASPTQIPAAPQRRRSVQYDTTNNNFAVPESRPNMRSSSNLQMDGYHVSLNGAGEQYQRSISLEDELKSKNQLISKLYEELDNYKKHAENLRHTLDERDRTNKELIASLQAQLQKEQENAQIFQQLAKHNEEQRLRLESVYKQMGDLMGGRQNNRSPDQMRPYPFGSGIMNVAATPSGDARTGGFHMLNGGKMSPDVDHLRYS